MRFTGACGTKVRKRDHYFFTQKHEARPHSNHFRESSGQRTACIQLYIYSNNVRKTSGKRAAFNRDTRKHDTKQNKEHGGIWNK